MEHLISRRLILKKAFHSVIGVASWSLIGSALLSSCKKKQTDNSQSAADSRASQPCPGQDNLTSEQLAIRKNLKYVDQSPISTRLCDNCKLYTNPVAGAYCGGCKVVPGPIHPKGYCSSWYARM